MSFVSLALGLAIAAVGILAIAWPESFAEILYQAQTPAGLYRGAGFRVFLGISLLLSARSSRAPAALRVLGVVFLVAGLVMPFLGFELFRSALESFLSLGPWAVRVWGGVALVLGLFVAYAVGGRRRGGPGA